jgi:hypothetical protein
MALYLAEFVQDGALNIWALSFASGNTAHIRRVDSQLVSYAPKNPGVKPVRL